MNIRGKLETQKNIKSSGSNAKITTLLYETNKSKISLKIKFLVNKNKYMDNNTHHSSKEEENSDIKINLYPEKNYQNFTEDCPTPIIKNIFNINPINKREHEQISINSYKQKFPISSIKKKRDVF